MQTRVVNIQRHILEQQRIYEGVSGDFSMLLNQIAFAAKLIAREVNKAGLVEILGLTGHMNIQGEAVMKLDAFANETFIKCLDHCGHVCIMASEENKDIIPIPEIHSVGKYVIAFDPLDGSSNIDANVSIGTIFSIYRRKTESGRGTLKDLLRKGKEQVCAGYVVYGSSTMLVYTTGNGVHGFTLDPSVGEFILSHENISIPSKGKIYSANEGNYPYWHEGTRKYIDYIKKTDKATGRPYSSRYIGSLVADFHRTLLYGGIFLYPEDTKDPKKPSGKLRYLYEAAPMAMIVERAGGLASTGRERILDIQCAELHQRVPLIIGSKEDVELYETFVQGRGE